MDETKNENQAENNGIVIAEPDAVIKSAQEAERRAELNKPAVGMPSVEKPAQWDKYYKALGAIYSNKAPGVYEEDILKFINENIQASGNCVFMEISQVMAIYFNSDDLRRDFINRFELKPGKMPNFKGHGARTDSVRFPIAYLMDALKVFDALGINPRIDLGGDVPARIYCEWFGFYLAPRIDSD